MLIKHSFILILHSILLTVSAQEIVIDARNISSEIKAGHLEMGTPGPAGKELQINNKYLTLSGKPIIPVMGEFHFSRCNKERWEDVILKMKANGINIIATYVFWIYHEETEGIFNWEGNNDLRSFILLCQKHGLWAYPRIGPWCHGEARNGGLPDWLVKRNDFRSRSNDSAYQYYADRWYATIAEQLSGLYYKEGGPIIGIQLENEYWRGKGGEAHILWLKKTAQNHGMDVPMYTVTGWRRASVPENEVIPLWGGYPAAPWNTNVKKIEHNESYIFTKPINDESIGHKEKSDGYNPDYSLYPYLTCELGVGNQLSEHRRPVIDALDGFAIALSNLASGSNLPGYYVFAGGLNPVGKYSTLEEDKLETGYWNEYPDISYDFQAAIRETGELAPSYQKVKILHYFLNDFGSELAPMNPVIPENNKETDHLQYALRTNGKQGYLFVSNYYRGQQKSVKKKVSFSIQLENETISIPINPIDIVDSTVFIWPFNKSLDNILLKYATAQLIFNIDSKESLDWYFVESKNIAAEFALNPKGWEYIFQDGKKIKPAQETVVIKQTETGLESPLIIQGNDGKTQKIFLLSQEEAEKTWFFKTANGAIAFHSNANLQMANNKTLLASSTDESYTVTALGCTKKLWLGSILSQEKLGGFQQLTIKNPREKIQVKVVKKDIWDDTSWLKVSPENYSSKKILYNKLFVKSVNLKNTATIRKATFYLLTEEECSLRANGKWINQTIVPQKKNRLDLTGYLKQGDNALMLRFPYSNDNKAFAGILEVEYYNSDKEHIVTDTSWACAESYKIPAPWESLRKTEKPITVKKPDNFLSTTVNPYRYQIYLDHEQLEKVETAYLRVDYSGNKAQCQMGKHLVADNFNNGTTWSIHLKDIGFNGEQPLIIELEPFTSDELIYFEKNMNFEKTEINKIKVEIENSEKIELE